MRSITMTELSKWEKASQAYMEEQEKSEYDVLLVFPRRGRVSRPAGGETPPLHGLTEVTVYTAESRFFVAEINKKQAVGKPL